MDPRGNVAALIVAAGSASRMGGGLPKQYRPLAGRTVLAHAVDRLRRAGIERIQVVIGAGQEALYAAATEGLALPAPVVGGASRQKSVHNGLEALDRAGAPEIVLIHDAARPFLPRQVVVRLLEALETVPGAVPVLPVADSLARGDSGLGAPTPRDGLVRVQTPQAFRFADILAAHRAGRSEADATDDAQVLRAAGGKVATVAGDHALEKLTYSEDFVRAEQWLSSRMLTCTGSGFDVHRFAEGDHVWLGGVRIDHGRGLAGHSDADVVLHAICDALLGTIGAGDIGDHFPPGDPKWRGAPSSGFVEHARDLVEAQGGRIVHIDVTIICETPRIGPHRHAMRERIAGLLRLPVARISVKATTTEGLGFTGRREGIAAQAIATVGLQGDFSI